MLEFHVPSDFNYTTVEKISQLNQQYENQSISEVYGQITEGEFVESGRMIALLPKADWKCLEGYVDLCSKNNICFDYVLNASCMSNQDLDIESRKKLRQYITDLYNIGVSTFTAALPAIIEIIQSVSHKIEIKVSAICEIRSADKAWSYKEKGLKRLVVDPDITRNFTEMERICKTFGDSVEIIINNMCLKNCPYKMFHYNHEAHASSENSGENDNYYFYKCSLQKAEKLINYIKLNWIRPEDIYLYEKAGIRCFKIQGRNNPNGDNILKAVRYYMDRSYEGNLLDLLTLFVPYNAFQPYIDNKQLDHFVERFDEQRDFCTDMCNQCGYCLSYAQKSMDMEQLQSLNQYASQLYMENIKI